MSTKNTNCTNVCLLYSGASTSSMHSVQTPQHSALFSQVQEWKIVPPTTYSLQPPSPSLIYGAVHLARLFGQCQILLFNVVNTLKFASVKKGTCI